MNIKWRKSSYSGGIDDKQCVELGRLAPAVGIGVRDSKKPDGGHLTLTPAQFTDIINQVKLRTER
ncbi:DUF397 domain-containing protein [Actinomadura nitritigenes]|uniref:DUF397 domain-containing protein n=1 Tax=Actinomadura nitritigenes TaxID=134602 RepID=UPI003D89D3C6